MIQFMLTSQTLLSNSNFHSIYFQYLNEQDFLDSVLNAVLQGGTELGSNSNLVYTRKSDPQPCFKD